MLMATEDGNKMVRELEKAGIKGDWTNLEDFRVIAPNLVTEYGAFTSSLTNNI